MSLTVGSLFAGIGGIEKGLEDTGGFKTVWQVELDDYARRVLAKHWPDVRRWDDVRTFPPPTKAECKCGRYFGFSVSCPWCKQTPFDEWQCDLICGGFPCQDISYAGRGAGLAGERSGLWFEYARIVRTLRPRYVLVENVAALLTRGLDAVLGTLASFGYDTEWHCIPAAAVGAPHIRDRVFILAYAEQVGRRTRSGKQGHQTFAGERRSESKGSNQEMADPICTRLEVEQRQPRDDGEECQAAERDGDWRGWWATEPNVGRVADGVPARVDRLRCLGNAVVPQVAEWIGRRILEAEES